jgi:hypothetical protein
MFNCYSIPFEQRCEGKNGPPVFFKRNGAVKVNIIEPKVFCATEEIIGMAPKLKSRVFMHKKFGARSFEDLPDTSLAYNFPNAFYPGATALKELEQQEGDGGDELNE